MIINVKLTNLLLQQPRFEMQSSSSDSHRRILRRNQRKKPMKLADLRMFWVCGENIELNLLHLDYVLPHFSADTNFLGMFLIAGVSLVVWLVAIMVIISSKIDISTEEKQFSLSYRHDNSIIVAYLSAFIVGFLAPLSVVNKETVLADYAKANAQITIWMLTVVSLVWAGRIALEVLVTNISGNIRS